MTENNLNEIYKADPPKKQGKKWKKGFLIWAIVLVCILAFGSLTAYTVRTIFAGPKESLPNMPYLAVMHVDGVISSSNIDNFGRAAGYQHYFTLDKIDDLILDPDNRALVLYLNTPGGGIYESDDLYFKIKEYQKETGRPVISYMSSMAASGGYYISAPADLIIANRNCWTGSIGVTIGTLYDVSEFLANHGIKTATITSGSNKAMGGMTEPLSDEQIQIFQGLVDEAYEQFIEIVAEGRNLPLDEVRTLADGRIYTAHQALDLGLIDYVSSYDDALEIIAEKFNLYGLPIHEITFKDHSLFGKLFDKLPLPLGPKNEVEAILSLVEQNNIAFPVSYTCPLLIK